MRGHQSNASSGGTSRQAIPSDTVMTDSGALRGVTASGTRQRSGLRDLSALVASPTTKGLFTRAGFLSNSCENFPTLASASRIGDEFARNVSCDSTADVAACLRRLPLEELRFLGHSASAARLTRGRSFYRVPSRNASSCSKVSSNPLVLPEAMAASSASFDG